MVGQTNPPSYETAAPRSGTPAVRAFISQMSETTQAAVARQRPWTELMDRTAFGKPESFADALSRMKKNISYFRMNYVIFMLVAVGISLLWHPISLIVLLILVVAWMYLYFFRSEPLVICGRTFGDNEVLVVLGIVTIVALFFTNVTANLITALVLGVAILCLHAAFRRPDDLFLNEQENASSRLLNFPTNGGSQSNPTNRV